jgi:hypothetical protein
MFLASNPSSRSTLFYSLPAPPIPQEVRPQARGPSRPFSESYSATSTAAQGFRTKVLFNRGEP